MSQPVIVCYRNAHNQRTVLIGSGDHLNLLVDSGYSDAAIKADKWFFGELVVEDGPDAIRVIIDGDDNTANLDPDIRFRMEDMLLRQVKDTATIIRHAKRYGFHPNLTRMLNKEHAKGIKDTSDKIVEKVRGMSLSSQTEYRRVLAKEGLLLVEKWAELFCHPENRIRSWRGLP